MKYININDPEELLLGKVEFENIEKKIAEKENREYEKSTIENFINKLDLSKTIFTYQNDEGIIEVIPYTIYNDSLVFYVDNKNDEMIQEFKNYINNIKKIKYTKLTYEKIFEEPLLNKYYIIKNNQVYLI